MPFVRQVNFVVHKTIDRVHLYPPEVEPVKSSLEAIQDADAVILGPGSLYTSVLPNLLVNGIAETLHSSSAIKIYICNVMTQPGETDGYTASMHAKAIIDHVGPGVIDYVLVNSAVIAPAVQEKYAKEGSYPVKVDEEALIDLGVRVLQADIISEDNAGHHDPAKLSRNIMNLVNQGTENLLDYYLRGNKSKH